MNPKLSVPIGIVLCMLCLASLGMCQKTDRLVVIGQVIGVENPEFGWPMEFESVKIFYVRVDKVVRGHSPAKFIRVAYGYNPSSSPKDILPDEMFDGRSKWKFDLYARTEFDGKVADDISPEMRKPRKISGTEVYPADDPRSKEEFWVSPVTRICEPTMGFEKEVEKLELLGELKGYWLGLGTKKYVKY